MPRSSLEWDPSWDDDWRAAETDAERRIEQESPPEPRIAREYFRYGFTAARRQPATVWPDVEQQLYEDYMAGEFDQENTESWDEARRWTQLGWHEGRSRPVTP